MEVLISSGFETEEKAFIEPSIDASCVMPPAENTFCEFTGVSTQLT